MPAVRGKNGRFISGKSGNPGGRKPIPVEVKDVLAANTLSAVNKLVDLLQDKDPHVVLKAANSLLDRAMGKPDQAHKIEGEGLGRVVVVIEEGSGD